MGNSQSYGYDRAGNLIEKTDFNGSKTTYTYDAENRLLEALFADGTKKQFSYDASGNMTGAENNARSYSYEYDSLHNLIAATDNDLAQTIHYEYDAEGRRTMLRRGERTQLYAYGEMGELISLTDADDGVTSYSYDALLRETSRTLPNGLSTQRSYDPAGRLSMVRTMNGRTVLAGEGYLYDASGKRTYTVGDDGRLEAYSYDQAGRLVKAMYSFGTDKVSADFEERLELGLYPEYRENASTENGGYAGCTFGFEIPDSVKIDIAAFKKELSQILWSKREVYNKNHKVLVDSLGLWCIAPSATKAFADCLQPTRPQRQQLEGAGRRVTGLREDFDAERWLWTESYAYDANGNMIQETLGTVSTVYEYNAENRVVDINTQERGLIGHWLLGADRELKSGVRYDYDAFGRRVTRAEYSTVSYGLLWKRQWDSGNVSEYLYDGRGMDVIAEYNDTDYNPGYASPYLPWLTGSRRPLLGAMLDWLSGRSLRGYGSRSSYELKAEYVYANGIVSRSDWSQGYRYSWKDRTEYYHTGFHGSVMMTSGESGLMTERCHYDAFGNNYAGSLAGHNTLGYGGKRYDPATGLYDYGFRDYDTRTGRFTTVDPVRNGTNWYAYCNNDPVNFFDLWGLCAVQDKAASNTNSDNFVDPTGMMDTENDSNSPNSNSAQNNIPDTNLSSINIQTPTAPNNYHCDIYAWNQV